MSRATFREKKSGTFPSRLFSIILDVFGNDEKGGYVFLSSRRWQQFRGAFGDKRQSKSGVALQNTRSHLLPNRRQRRNGVDVIQDGSKRWRRTKAQDRIRGVFVPSARLARGGKSAPGTPQGRGFLVEGCFFTRRRVTFQTAQAFRKLRFLLVKSRR